MPNPRTYVSSKGYSFTKGQTGEFLGLMIVMDVTAYVMLNNINLHMILFFAEVLSSKIIPLKQKVEAAEGGDAMEE